MKNDLVARIRDLEDQLAAIKQLLYEVVGRTAGRATTTAWPRDPGAAQGDQVQSQRGPPAAGTSGETATPPRGQDPGSAAQVQQYNSDRAAQGDRSRPDKGDVIGIGDDHQQSSTDHEGVCEKGPTTPTPIEVDGSADEAQAEEEEAYDSQFWHHPDHRARLVGCLVDSAMADGVDRQEFVDYFLSTIPKAHRQCATQEWDTRQANADARRHLHGDACWRGS